MLPRRKLAFQTLWFMHKKLHPSRAPGGPKRRVWDGYLSAPLLGSSAPSLGLLQGLRELEVSLRTSGQDPDPSRWVLVCINKSSHFQCGHLGIASLHLVTVPPVENAIDF